MSRKYLAAVMLGLGLLSDADADNRDRQWKAVDQALREGLPKTASASLDSIAREALGRRDYPDAARAIAQGIAVESPIQGQKPEERILRLQDRLDNAPAAMQPVLEAILAHWYWQYFQENSWRFAQRSTTAGPPGKDFQTWDLPRIYAEIDLHFRRALEEADLLRRTPIAAWDKLIARGDVPDVYRPTLYDFIAHEAIRFYASGEQAAAKPEDSFEIGSDDPIFDSADAFLRWRPATSDTASPSLRAIHLFQELLRFHARDSDPSARIDVDLERVSFAWNVASGADKTERYHSALRRMAEREAGHEMSAWIRATWAASVMSGGDRAEARRIARVGVDRFPDSPGGRACFNLIQDVESRSLSLTTERVWSTPGPTIDVHYRNLDRIHFRLVAVDFEGWIRSPRRPNLPYMEDADLDSVLALKPAHIWSAGVPGTPDFRERDERLPSPRGLRSGFYLLLACDSPAFDRKHHPVFGTVVWVSDLALVVGTDSRLGGLVVDAGTGNPIAGARVRWWTQRQSRPDGSTNTDRDGKFFVSVEQRHCWLIVTHGDQQLGYEGGFYEQDYVHRPFERTLFFTDRAIYRPGQTIRYKGLCVSVDQEKDRYQTIPREDLTVVFRDPNGKEVARQTHETNDYGSFHGSFIAPSGRLLGGMSLAVDAGPSGYGEVRVEEYKRPKFQVVLEPPRATARLGDPVEVSGVATAYTGAAVDGASVRWRVVREVRYPIWWWWFWWREPRALAKEVAHGVATTGSDGHFAVQFVTEPDRSVAEDREPTFSFTVTADVTDPAGETRSASRAVRVGYTALRAELSANAWQVSAESVKVTLRTTTHDAVAAPAGGRLVIVRLRQPERVERDPVGDSDDTPYDFDEESIGRVREPDLTTSSGWGEGDEVFDRTVTTDTTGVALVSTKLAPGVYRARFETRDRFGKEVKAVLPIQVLDPNGSRCPIRVPDLLVAPKWSWEPGEEFVAIWGSGYEQARAYVEVEHRGKILQAYWTAAGRSQAAVRQRVTEGMRGGFLIRVTMVREGRAYLHVNRVDVPWSNQRLALRWEHFVSKLGPAQRETWTAVVTGPDATRAAAEMVATLYDASLDAFIAHSWPGFSDLFRIEGSMRGWVFNNGRVRVNQLRGDWIRQGRSVSRVYRSFPPQVLWDWGSYGPQTWGNVTSLLGPDRRVKQIEEFQVRGGRGDEVKYAEGVEVGNVLSAEVADGLARKSGVARPPAEPPPAPEPDLAQVVARRNLEETAFFFPQLVTDEKGEVRMTFTMPEALTEWRFLGFVHDTRLRSGFLDGRATTSKDLMVQPNPPRFLREGDVIELTVKVTNLSDQRQSGKVSLSLSDGATGEPADAAFDNHGPEQSFDVPARHSHAHSWRIHVPDGAGVLEYKAVASTGTLSDGEEAFVPVLSRSVLVTESLPLPIRGPRTRTFDFGRLRTSAASSTLRHQSLTVQMVSNPAWYAVMALPYLMEYPYECVEQTFNRLYANALARHIANSDPKIRRVFDLWRGTPALDSPLEKNQDLKSVLLEETPWLRQGEAESQARRNVGILFDANRLDAEQAEALSRLAGLQLADGAWPWFPGGPPDDFITLYVTTGFGRLRHLGVAVDMAPALRSLDRLDRWAITTYQGILKDGHKEDDHLSPTIALYLYGRTFFLEDRPIIRPDLQEAVGYWREQARRYWLQLPSRQSQGHVALALHRFGDTETPLAILRSLRERAVTNEELGMFWRDEERSWWWYRAPIESQAIMIEAFDEIAHDAATVEECRVWLLKQKQTQDWKTTKATADAIYALLLRGQDVLASNALVEVTLGGTRIRPQNVEAGTGFYERRFTAREVSSQMASITVRKTDQGVGWGSVHWQYFEDMDKVSAYSGTPLTLHKALFVRRATSRGPVIEAVQGPVAVGDELVVRIELRADRDMEYVHLKDYRGSGVEPVNVLSGFRMQDGLGYYEQTRDAASHFFIHYLPKGTYVFEYSTRVQHRGRYQTGFAQIQCMYAPEFNSHSEGFTLEVR